MLRTDCEAQQGRPHRHLPPREPSREGGGGGHGQPTQHPAAPLQGAKRMQMFVGAQRGEGVEGGGTVSSVTSLPAPKDPVVKLEAAGGLARRLVRPHGACAVLMCLCRPHVPGAAGGELMAVLRFEGYITPETAAAVRKQLVTALQKGKWGGGGGGVRGADDTTPLAVRKRAPPPAPLLLGLTLHVHRCCRCCCALLQMGSSWRRRRRRGCSG